MQIEEVLQEKLRSGIVGKDANWELIEWIWVALHHFVGTVFKLARQNKSSDTQHADQLGYFMIYYVRFSLFKIKSLYMVTYCMIPTI